MDESIRTIFFDFDGTLCFHEPDSFDVVSAFCTEIGQPLDAERQRLGRRVRHQYFADAIIRKRLDSMTPDEFWFDFNRYLLDAMGIEGDLDQIARTVQDRFVDLDLTYHCPSDACHTLEELRARGYGLGIITNREDVDRFYELLDRVELRNCFDTTLASGEVGISKPEPGVFHAALDRIGARADESVYIGDNYWADVVGARRAGVMPILYDPHNLFPDADCLTVQRIDTLLEWLP